ncbi:MAG: hypothetical protein JWO36_2286 [Myxococcales bacterium]|nr:hypothetical protein [Myxococcales bacterium]
MRLVLLAVVVLACGPHGGVKRPYPELTVAEILDRLAKVREARTSFTADSTMDYWLANQRAKGEVLVMGTTGAKVRFAALSPAGGSTLAEMACDGANFVYVDYQNNCALTGPCDQRSIAQFFHLELAPDDFVHLALGTPPVLANATGTVTWDADKGYERVALTGPEGKQTLVIDAKDGKLDVISSELSGPDGKIKWSVTNADFVDVDGQRLPAKTSFKSPAEKQDLLVDWGERKINVPLDPSKFKLTAPAGLATCGQQAPPASPPDGRPTTPPSAAKPKA